MMSEKYVTLMGAEQVQQAAGTMREAANTIHRAANEITYALEKHSNMMRELVDTLVRMEDHKK
jgi:hypothetical protein